ncbi:Gfo/Idh/MocA family protein [Paenibacillus eucommiae]|uniref:Dehydrogenase n=1 Tax=Paenibacillus eucommiae TaxID=1355755 RepID=A0ABS4ITF4_9BACL|nr:Gfo/Idh/MocA family oxidoreductase [Paenibacillus eucommiae]MBP1990845.1 putative dehydrogenase [Paenibacillus eucommiae]
MGTVWRFGIIGCGGIAKFHADSLRELEAAELVSVASRSAEKTKAFAEEYGCDWTTDYLSLLERSDIDIICVTSSTGSHAQIGRDVLQAGKHLVIEKPIAIDAKEAQELIDLAEAQGVTLSVISQRRFEPVTQHVKQLLDEGKLGRLLLVESGTPYLRTQEYYDSADWRGTIAEDGGALMNQGIHQIDLLLWLGGPVHSVYGKTATMTHQMEAEDMGVAIVKFAGGAMGTIMSSTSIKPGFAPYIHLYGEKGTIKISGQSIEHWTVEGVEAPDSPEAQVSDGSSNPLAISHVYHKAQLAEIMDALNNGRPSLVGGAEGKQAVELIQAISASSLSGKEIILQGNEGADHV